MAKKSSITRNDKRAQLASRYSGQRAELKAKIYDKNTSISERFALQVLLASLPRNSSRTRIRNRCIVTGRPRGYHRQFGVSRIVFRELASIGAMPGVKKASW